MHWRTFEVEEQDEITTFAFVRRAGTMTGWA